MDQHPPLLTGVTMRSLTLTPLLLASAYALPEIHIDKRDKHNNGATNYFARAIPGRLRKRQDTVETNIFNVLSWSSGGAYYANSKSRGLASS